MEILVPENKEEEKLWSKWSCSGLTDEDCVILLKQHREEEKRLEKKGLEEHNARLLELYKQGKMSKEEFMRYYIYTPDPKQDREANIVIACILAVPVILIVLAVFFFISQPMILMCIIWVIGMLLAMAFGR